MKKVLSFGLVCFLLTSCSHFASRFLEKPEVELQSVFAKDTSFIGTTLVFVVNVKNPNNQDINVKEIAYKIFVADKELTEAKTEKPIHVPAKKDANIEIPLPLKYDSLLSHLGNALMAGEIGYRIEGDAKLSFMTIPFSESGKVELR
ncbi:LEA type 2 family protein [Bdellovibrio sp. 22V]|uniref:LEA type 2 family protein n=1 Tax=Bdellovibrio TaxID=958 RepID=UPI00254341A8|nr:LEA type 2 family protein [Bdellovibrio sp. 22V]WII71477.1 LEA type 2 family protein [Bdellovibrio sp. 22V]